MILVRELYLAYKYCLDRNIRPKKFSFYCGQDINGVWTPMTPKLTVHVNEMSTTLRGRELKLMEDGKDVNVLWVSVFDRCPFRKSDYTYLFIPRPQGFSVQKQVGTLGTRLVSKTTANLNQGTTLLI